MNKLEVMKIPLLPMLPRGAVLFLAVVLCFMSAAPLKADRIRYKEQFFRLYHLHYVQYPDDTMENIYWLEKALQADFANPLYAVALIEDEAQWEKYQYLFMMHLNLKIIEQYLFLGNKWNKRQAYFYNAPWAAGNLESLAIAETCFKAALSYWDEAVSWATKAQDRRFRFVQLDRVQYWQEEAHRIQRQDLDYEKIIRRELGLLQKVRERFQSFTASPALQ